MGLPGRAERAGRCERGGVVGGLVRSEGRGGSSLSGGLSETNGRVWKGFVIGAFSFWWWWWWWEEEGAYLRASGKVVGSIGGDLWRRFGTKGRKAPL